MLLLLAGSVFLCRSSLLCTFAMDAPVVPMHGGQQEEKKQLGEGEANPAPMMSPNVESSNTAAATRHNDGHSSHTETVMVARELMPAGLEPPQGNWGDQVRNAPWDMRMEAVAGLS